MLGICRGAQLINVAHGGTLVLDLRRNTATALEHQGPEEELHSAVHTACVSADSLLSTLLGAGGSLEVNSAHHQGIARVGGDLRIVAVAPDAAIEAIESADPGKVILGVQWHPENLWCTETHARRLLREFSRLCAARRVLAPDLT